ncbi:hypothetical protein [Paracoccus sp. AK26]|uniref:hypothetical protein n=1 Tax=Paracoccus sp. AK26 TaxID=2589076 RepID=UPI0014281A4D|nr:hypothetical protein [Paracoccus sp. AK26]QIR84618.1 hypothetical protein FIU66_04985 [Paracoccus sp. AK26]
MTNVLTASRLAQPSRASLGEDQHCRRAGERRSASDTITPKISSTSIRSMTMSKVEPIAQATKDVVEEFLRTPDPALLGSLMKLADFAEANGEISHDYAIHILAAPRGMNERKARPVLSQLIEAGWLIEKEDMLAIKGWGTRITRN